MYVVDIKLFAQNEKESEILKKAVRINRHDIGMESGIEKFAMLIMKSEKRHMTEGMGQPNQEKKTGRSEKRKLTNI